MFKKDTQRKCMCTAENCPVGTVDCSVVSVIDKFATVAQNTSEMGYNDADILEVGNGGMNFEQYKTQMSFWVPNILTLGCIQVSDHD
jgi:alpha-galactosidase